MRRDAVTFLKDDGVKIPEGASLLCMSAGTLRGWRRRHDRGVLGPNLLGRPPYLYTDQTEREIRGTARAVGLKVSVRYVREKMGHLPRAVVERVVRDYKRELHRDLLDWQQKLNWEEAGRVWCCDWTEPETPVDGMYGQILVVRDLGAGFNLKSLPVVGKSAAMACRVMESLFIAYGAPLVLKTDGGSEFLAGVFKELMQREGVVHLVSPFYYPPYNGSIEAGIGSLKTHAWHEALRRGRRGHLTCDDVEAGRLIANETSRPWGPKGMSPNQVWRSRSPISDGERVAFIRSHNENRKECDKLDERTESERKTDERRAIERTLVDGGYLVVNRRRITPGVYGEKAANIT